jgi:hypothetical protein
MYDGSPLLVPVPGAVNPHTSPGLVISPQVPLDVVEDTEVGIFNGPLMGRPTARDSPVSPEEVPGISSASHHDHLCRTSLTRVPAPSLQECLLDSG